MSFLDEKSEDAEDPNFIANPKELDGVPDLSQLVYLEMEHVLHNLHYRYSFMKAKHCYTSISTILVAINPYERLPIYGEDVIDEFHQSAKKGRLLTGRPHPYGVSARGYLRMIQRKKNQSIIVCGESGAGKTETTKLLMRYLAMTAPSTSMQTSIVEQQIIAASPILEAYGNAKTVMNNNSSRFGKFTKLLYDVRNGKEGYVLGSYLETYLLEKSRVVFQSNNERNYHIFYFLENGLKNDKSLYNDLCLDNCDNYWYTNQGKTSNVSSINDKDRFKELMDSLNLMRIDNDMQPDLWKLTSGILNLGNVEFTKQGDGFASVNTKKSGKYVKAVSQLWGISEESLIKRLTTANMKIVGKTIETKVKFDDSVSNRDSIAKGIYEKIFLWLVTRINAELYNNEIEDDVGGDSVDIASILFIGILDVFGFENFYINSLEQFCINFTNEKLQQYFNFHIIRSEQEEYIKESVFWKPLSIPDNLEYIQMVEDSKIGFFTILDSSCKAAKPDPVAFTQELFKNHGKNPTIHKSNKPGSGNCRGKPANARKLLKGTKFSGFMINHFADDVTYDVSKFIIKNMESVHSDTAKMFDKSDYLLAKQIGGSKLKQTTKRRKKLTVTGTFHKGIRTLMKNLKATEPFFVRCVNPNTKKSKDIWTESVVEHQLRCGGLVEALKVLKLGYPTRVPYSTLYDRYHGNVTNPLIKNMGPEEFATVLLIAFDVCEDDYELGLTKIFFKPSKAKVLDTIMAQAGQPLSAEQNAKITKWIVNKRVNQMIGVTKAFLELRKRVRMVRAQQAWEHSGRITAILGGSVLRHLQIARETIRKRKQNAAALLLQTLFRGSYERERYTKHIEKVKKSAKSIWIAYHRMQERRLFTEWIDNKVIETQKRKELERINEIKAEQAREAEQKRIEQEKQRLKQEEEARAEQLRLQEIERANKKKQEELALAQDKEEQIKKQMIASTERKQLEHQKEQFLLQKAKEERDNSIKLNKEKIAEEEDTIYAQKQAQILSERFPELVELPDPILSPKRSKSLQSSEHKSPKSVKSDKSDKSDGNGYDSSAINTEPYSSSEEEYEEDTGSMDEMNEQDADYGMERSIKQQLKYFRKTAQLGQLFLKYTGKRRRKPQDRVVKVSFDSEKKPIQISWGSGSRHIDFNEIQYVSYGHMTPVFDARKDLIDDKLCFSVVGTNQILDVQAQTIELALLWVRGLRGLLGQTDEKSDEMAKKMFESGNLKQIGKVRNSGDGGDSSGNMGGRGKMNDDARKRAQDLIKLQQDLFIMTTSTVFRNLEEDGIWEIDQSVRERFNAKVMYGQVLKLDVPWRQWNHWIRKQIVTYLKQQRMHKYNGSAGAGVGVGGGGYGVDSVSYSDNYGSYGGYSGYNGYAYTGNSGNGSAVYPAQMPVPSMPSNSMQSMGNTQSVQNVYNVHNVQNMQNMERRGSQFYGYQSGMGNVSGYGTNTVHVAQVTQQPQAQIVQTQAPMLDFANHGPSQQSPVYFDASTMSSVNSMSTTKLGAIAEEQNMQGSFEQVGTYWAQQQNTQQQQRQEVSNIGLNTANTTQKKTETDNTADKDCTLM